ncbi:endonuclease [Mycoplasma zalophidermidis]|uniref:Endonuclease n=1 Tax=Mycoplasma zalophidermidis TaxID=398174 RepID=A0ABS6DSH4_9MOLU|nr:endonuclease [Mycoplasma zalophidermidis]MBU4689900.1 endonuclease [Mycoplasma zalophidermidis]MBU4693809.1 endonuclease [Mycoplasma zalophidermidis]
MNKVFNLNTLALSFLVPSSIICAAKCDNKNANNSYLEKIASRLVIEPTELIDFKSTDPKNVISKLNVENLPLGYEISYIEIKPNGSVIYSLRKTGSDQEPQTFEYKIKEDAVAIDKNTRLVYKKDSYYSSLEGLNGKALFDELLKLQQSKIRGIKTYAYLYNVYKDAFLDKYYEKDNTILDIYSENPKGQDPYYFTYEFHEGKDADGSSGKSRSKSGEGSKYNREHIVPQSWFGKVEPTRNDAHFIFPTDKLVNNERGNYPHYIVKNPTFISRNGTKVDKTNGICEPIDEFKGDVARAYFYFVVTHNNSISNDLFENSFPYITKKYLEVYKKWSNQDDIDAFDVDRNNAIARHYNGLRNPFSDYPELIDLIWFKTDSKFHNKGIAIAIK